MTHYYCVISVLCIAALLILSGIIQTSDTLEKNTKQFFLISLFAIILVIGAEIVVTYFNDTAPAYRKIHLLGNVVGFSLSPFIPLLIGRVIYPGVKKADRLFWVPAGINTLACVLSIRVPLIFSVDSMNHYTRGSYFGVYVAAYAVGVLFLFLKTRTATGKHQNPNRCILYVLFVFFLVGTSLQVAVPHLQTTWLCVSFSMGLYYTYYCGLNYQVDGLTGLLSRQAYESYLHKTDGAAQAVVLIFDIDHFKEVNDQYGHPFGDFCLTTVSLCIKKNFSPVGLCFRIGGDEFCVIGKKPDKTAIDAACITFLQQIEMERYAEPRLPMVSIGCAYAGKEPGSMGRAVFAADQDMYRFKQLEKESVQAVAAVWQAASQQI